MQRKRWCKPAARRRSPPRKRHACSPNARSTIGVEGSADRLPGKIRSAQPGSAMTGSSTAFAINEQVLSLEQVKWIILFVLWSQNEPQQFIFVEDFLFGDMQPTMH
jgi:hypothetical protein